MANTFKFGNGEWAVGKETALAYNDENSNFKPLPFTFDRASTATVVNKDGLIETVGTDEPRIDFLNNTKGHLLLEPSRTNSLVQSNQFGAWTINNTPTLEANALISPEGVSNAYEFTTNAISEGVYLASSTLTSGQKYTYSVFLKYISGSEALVRLRLQTGSFATNVGVIANIENGTIDSNIGGVTSDIQDYGNGWYRLIFTGTASSTATTNFTIYSYTANSFEWGVYGAQLEQGSYATSYIPTSGQSGGVTRSAENTTTQDNVPSTVIGQTEGTVYTEFKIYETPTGTHRIIILSDGTGNERIGISVGSGILYAFIVDGGSTQCEIVKSSFTSGTYKVAFGYKANDFVLYLNGVQVGTDNSGSVSSCNRIDLGNQFNVSQLEGNIIDTKLYNTRLSNSELAALTS